MHGCIPADANLEVTRRSQFALPVGSENLCGTLRLLGWQIFLPVSNREMPPLGAQSVKAGISHCDLQQMYMRADLGISACVVPHCGRGEIVKVAGHSNGAIPGIDQGGIDSDTPAMQ